MWGLSIGVSNINNQNLNLWTKPCSHFFFQFKCVFSSICSLSSSQRWRCLWPHLRAYNFKRFAYTKNAVHTFSYVSCSLVSLNVEMSSEHVSGQRSMTFGFRHKIIRPFYFLLILSFSTIDSIVLNLVISSCQCSLFYLNFMY